MKGFLTSFRGRLTVMSLVILVIGLSAYSLVVGLVELSSLSSHINQDLVQRGRMLAFGGPPPPGRLGEQMRSPGNGFGGHEEGHLGPPAGPPDQIGEPGRPRDDEPRTDQNNDAFFGGREPGPNSDLRRARFLDESGDVVGGFAGDQSFNEMLFQGALHGQEGFADITIDGQPSRVFATPWLRRNGERGVVEVARDLRDYEDLKRTQIWTWLALTPLAVILSAVGASVLAGRVLKPVQSMQSAAADIGRGDFSQRLPVNGEDEMASLAQTFNIMAGNLQKSFEDQAAAYENLREAYESQQRFTADASHELRTPLARMQLATSSALRGPENGYKEALEIADDSARSMAKLIRELLVLARADAGQLGLKHDALDLRLVVSDALNGFQREVVADFPHSAVTIAGDQDHLGRVVANLVDNAIRHTPADKPISVSLTTEGADAVLVVEDAGEGIGAEHLPHLFDRFYRADAARGMGEGVGLGLAICKSVAEAHGGSISVQSVVGKGTRFEVRLPLAGKK